MTDPARPGRNILSSAIEAMTQLADELQQVPSLERVAEVIDVPLSDLQCIVSDSDRLLDLTAENALMLLYDSCVRLATATCSRDPIGQYAAMVDGYIAWANDHPREFRLIGRMPASAFARNDLLRRYEGSIHAVMRKILERARDEGVVPPDQDIGRVIIVTHIFAHGLVNKMLQGNLARWHPGLTDQEAAAVNMRTVIDRFLRS